MINHPWNDKLIMTREQIREYDRIAVEDVGMLGGVLMENAGRGAAEIAIKMWDGKNRIAVVAGPGNNGGDGFVIARHLINTGIETVTYLALPRKRVKGDALVNLEILDAMGATIVDVSSPSAIEALHKKLAHDSLIVDGLLGTGVSRDVEGHLARLIEVINEIPVPTLSVDIPSGLDANAGRPWGVSVQADVTATFGHLKRGLILHPGVDLAGDVKVVPIGVPGFVSKKAGVEGEMLCSSGVRSLAPKRKSDAHKGTAGHLLIVAGSLGKTGAAALTGHAAMRVGTGLVTIATTEKAQPVIESKCEEIMVSRIIERTDAPLTEKAIKLAAALVDGKKALAIGPGISTAPGISALVMRVLQMIEVPAVIDADGINIMAKDPSGASRITAPLILTPHPGEMARLINKTVPHVQSDRIGVAREAAKWHRMVIVLKGAHTVIASPSGDIFVNPTGNSGMASGGMGDVLTGIIGGLLAQELPPLEAALLGTYIHGMAGDKVAERKGKLGLVASDVVNELPSIFKEWSL